MEKSDKTLNGSSGISDVFDKFPEARDSLPNSVAIITGANSGIGLELCRGLSSVGCHVILACRSEQRTSKVISQIKEELPESKLTYIHLDLQSLASVKRFATEFLSLGIGLNYLFLNAAVNGLSSITNDGLESTFQINFFSHFYLVKLLEKALRDSSTPSASTRVVFVSSESHRQSLLSVNNLENPGWRLNSLSSMFAYNDSKLMAILMAGELDRRWKGNGVRAVSCHPGNLVFTNIQQYSYLLKALYYLSYPFTKTPKQAAATILYSALVPLEEERGLRYYNNCSQCPPSSSANDSDLSKALYEYSERLLSQHLSY